MENQNEESYIKVTPIKKDGHPAIALSVNDIESADAALEMLATAMLDIASHMNIDPETFKDLCDDLASNFTYQYFKSVLTGKKKTNSHVHIAQLDPNGNLDEQVKQAVADALKTEFGDK